MSEQSQPRPAPQCCSDHVEAAKTGNVECLCRLQEAGRFLGLHDPERESAGEARKLEVWDAAVAACKAGHAQVLSWLFSGGWPDAIDIKFPWYLSDLAQPQGEVEWEELHSPDMPHRTEWFLPELTLYHFAMKNTDTSCLEALLKAGCRSVWLCPMAALEGREGHLALAAARGARCDARTMYPAASKGNLPVLQTAHHHATIQAGAMSGSPLLDWCGRRELIRCFEAAAQNGHADCLAALLTWLDNDFLWEAASVGAARGGHISLLEMLQRRGWEGWASAAYNAAKAGQVESLIHLFGLHALQRQFDQMDDYTAHDDRDYFGNRDVLTGSKLLQAAAVGGVACLKLCHDRGFKLTKSVLISAVSSGNPECVRYALDHTQEKPWRLLDVALLNDKVSCLQVLYDRGCLARSGQFWHLLRGVEREFLKVVGFDFLRMMVANSGQPPTRMLSTAVAASRGPAFLQYIHELGALWDPTTMIRASASVDVMRYAHENGCPWGQAVMSHFILNGECLQYAHENGCAYDVPPCAIVLPAFQALRYAWKHMDRAWVKELVVNVVKRSTCRQSNSPTAVLDSGDTMTFIMLAIHGTFTPQRDVKFDWRVPLILVKEMKMGRDELGILAQLADVRLARAAALAQCFYVAGKYTCQPQRGRWADIWSAMARCPTEVREKIAVFAHLAVLAS